MMVPASVGGRADVRPLKAPRHTWAGIRAPSRTRSSMYHGGTGWILGNHVNDFLTQATSMGSVSCSTSSANAGRPCNVRGDPTRTRPARRSGLRIATCWATYPPLDDPNSTAEEMPTSCMNASTSSARLSRE